MFFRRNEGQYRETDRVTRFKLVKSGKHWLRAATSNFGLFKVLRGGVDTPSVGAPAGRGGSTCLFWSDSAQRSACNWGLAWWFSCDSCGSCG